MKMEDAMSLFLSIAFCDMVVDDEFWIGLAYSAS